MIKKILFSVIGIVCSTIFFGSSAFADSPTVVVDGSNYTNEAVICDSSNPCNAYDFIHISSTLTGLNNHSYLRLSVNNTAIVYNYYILTDVYIPTDNISSFKYGILDNYYNWGDDSLVFTLENMGSNPSATLEITSNGTYDVTNYSSAVVNVPSETVEIVDDPISNDFQKVFFAIVEKIIPTFGVILVVWFGIDMLSSLIFGRGR